MKRIAVTSAICLLVMLALPLLGFNRNAEAAVFEIGLSPPESGVPGVGPLNLGANPYTRDHAVFIARDNENVVPVSMATGNEVGAGITYDDVTNILSFDFAYGSAFGFVDLGRDFTDVHFHAPGPVNFPAANTNAAVIFDLAGSHTPSGPLSGRVTGTVTLSAGQETNLFDNEIYVNIHSTGAPAGEIRAQLIPVTPGFVPVELQHFSID